MRTARNTVNEMAKEEVVAEFMKIKDNTSTHSKKIRELIVERAIRIDNHADNNVDVLRHGIAEYRQNRQESPDDKLVVVVSRNVFIDLFNLSGIEGSGSNRKPEGLYVDDVFVMTFEEIAKFVEIPEGLKPNQFMITELKDEYLIKPEADPAKEVKVVRIMPKKNSTKPKKPKP